MTSHAQPFAVRRSPRESPFADAYALMCATMDDLEDREAASDRTDSSIAEWAGA